MKSLKAVFNGTATVTQGLIVFAQVVALASMLTIILFNIHP